MFRKNPPRDPHVHIDAQMEQRLGDRLETALRVTSRDLETQIARQGQALTAALRTALAPAPGVRVLLVDRRLEYPTAVSWDIRHGNLIVNLAGGDIAAQFAHGEWRGVERMTSES